MQATRQQIENNTNTHQYTIADPWRAVNLHIVYL